MNDLRMFDAAKSKLVLCSGDAEPTKDEGDFSQRACANPANWMALPVDVDERAPFCQECIDATFEHSWDGKMTFQMAHLWIAQGRLCTCAHPGDNCSRPATIVLETYEADETIYMAICSECISCGNGPFETLLEIVNGLQPVKARE